MELNCHDYDISEIKCISIPIMCFLNKGNFNNDLSSIIIQLKYKLMLKYNKNLKQN